MIEQQLPAAALSGLLGDSDPAPSGYPEERGFARQRRSGVNPRFTLEPVRVPCERCGTPHPPGTKTGLCRACWLADHPGKPGKDDPEHQLAFLLEMLESRARRAKEEDPEVGLAGLLVIQRRLRQLVNEVGCAVTARDGQAPVAHALSVSRVAVHKRWGGA